MVGGGRKPSWWMKPPWWWFIDLPCVQEEHPFLLHDWCRNAAGVFSPSLALQPREHLFLYSALHIWEPGRT